MPLKQERTSYSASNNLKTALSAKGFSVIPQIGECHYDGSAAEFHLILADFPNGTFRTNRYFASSLSDPDIVSASDTALVRMYVEEELQQLIASIPGVSSSSGSQGGLPLIWTWTITRNGTEYTRTDTKKADAICKAITAVVNAL